MVFSSPFFLFVFLPLTVIPYLLLRNWKHKNIFLLIASLVFYIFGEGELVLLMLLSIVANFYFGKLIEKKQTKTALGLGVGFNIILLLINKYTGFFVESINSGLSFMEIAPLPVPKIKLPIGISFYTFQSISYLMDVYRKENEAQKKFSDLALYITLFPQLIAGPIVRYKDVAIELKNRAINIFNLQSGIKRFVLGLGKKVLIANTLGFYADTIFDIPVQDQTTFISWIGIICYSFQIYFDFAGYSDMAIGLGRMLGFHFLENFNFPYISKSIQEFWRRWHISLSNWFRDYCYIPLGGNRKGNKRTYLNLFLVFLLTGFWHGAGWNFIFWGLFHGFFMIIERLGFIKVLEKIWRPLQHLYVLLLVMVAWVFFRADSFGYAMDYSLNLFGISSKESSTINFQAFLNKELIYFIIIALLGSTKILENGKIRLQNLLAQKQLTSLYQTIEVFGISAILILCLFSVGMGSYNPFIYFRF